jgi:cell division protein FtsB
VIRTIDSPLVKPLPPRRGQSVWLRRALIFATIVVLVNTLVGHGGMIESRRAQRKYAAAAATLAQLQHENAMMAERVRKLSGDRRTIEGAAREELGLIRPGEIMFLVEPVQPLPTPNSAHD